MFGHDGDGVELEVDAFCHVAHPRLVHQRLGELRLDPLRSLRLEGDA